MAPVLLVGLFVHRLPRNNECIHETDCLHDRATHTSAIERAVDLKTLISHYRAGFTVRVKSTNDETRPDDMNTVTRSRNLTRLSYTKFRLQRGRGSGIGNNSIARARRYREHTARLISLTFWLFLRDRVFKWKRMNTRLSPGWIKMKVIATVLYLALLWQATIPRRNIIASKSGLACVLPSDKTYRLSYREWRTRTRRFRQTF